MSDLEALADQLVEHRINGEFLPDTSLAAELDSHSEVFAVHERMMETGGSSALATPPAGFVVGGEYEVRATLTRTRTRTRIRTLTLTLTRCASRRWTRSPSRRRPSCPLRTSRLALGSGLGARVRVRVRPCSKP